MTDEKTPETIGEKADLIASAKRIMILAPYPLGWQHVDRPENWSISVRALSKLKVTGEISGLVSIEVIEDDK